MRWGRWCFKSRLNCLLIYFKYSIIHLEIIQGGLACSWYILIFFKTVSRSCHLWHVCHWAVHFTSRGVLIIKPLLTSSSVEFFNTAEISQAKLWYLCQVQVLVPLFTQSSGAQQVGKLPHVFSQLRCEQSTGDTVPASMPRNNLYCPKRVFQVHWKRWVNTS